MSQLPPLTSTALAALLTATGAFAGPTIQALGDSITSAYVSNSYFNHPTYQAQIANNVPAWTQGTAYGVGNLVKSGGTVFRCTSGGTAGGTAPAGTGSGIGDGGATWAAMPTMQMIKGGQHMLSWAEWFNPRLTFDLSMGYGGLANSLLKVLVTNGGAGYAAGDTVAFNNGAAGTLQVTAGAVTGVTVTNPGYDSTGSWSSTITTSTGAGATLSCVRGGSGTFSVPGCTVADMVARLPDVLAAGPTILVVHGGTNNALLTGRATLSTDVATTWAGLKLIYDTCQQAGIKVIAVPVTPRAYNTTPVMRTFLNRLNRLIRGYCRASAAFNTQNLTGIALADPTKYWTDPTTGGPVGGTGGTPYAVTLEGLHNSPRGAAFSGYCVAKAAERWVGAPDNSYSRNYGADDGYDSLFNPGGNMLEGVDWATHFMGYPAVLGQQCVAGGLVWKCSTAGTCATSGSGPSGAIGSVNVADGSAKWDAIYLARQSVMGAGASGTLTAPPAGVTASGAVASGWALARTGGGAVGTLTAAVSAYANGQGGVRQALTFSLGAPAAWVASTAYAVGAVVGNGGLSYRCTVAGTSASSGGPTGTNTGADVTDGGASWRYQGNPVSERWDLNLAYGAFGAYGYRNILASDLGTTPFTAEVEVEIAGTAMLNRLNLFVGNADADKTSNFAGPCVNSAVGYELPPTADSSVTDPMVADLGGALPNGGRMVLRLGPFVLPPNLGNCPLGLSIGFNAGGAAGSAKGTVFVNRVALHKQGVA